MSHDRSKLPMWAQEEFGRLEAALAGKTEELERARRIITGDPGTSDTFASPHDLAPRGLGNGTEVRFGGRGFDGTFDVICQEGTLSIHGNNAVGAARMIIRPHSSNRFYVEWITQ